MKNRFQSIGSESLGLVLSMVGYSILSVVLGIVVGYAAGLMNLGRSNGIFSILLQLISAIGFGFGGVLIPLVVVIRGMVKLFKINGQSQLVRAGVVGLVMVGCGVLLFLVGREAYRYLFWSPRGY